MLRDAHPSSFPVIHIVCGRADMRYGVDSLASVIENLFHLPLFMQGTYLIPFFGKKAYMIKGLIWEAIRPFSLERKS